MLRWEDRCGVQKWAGRNYSRFGSFKRWREMAYRNSTSLTSSIPLLLQPSHYGMSIIHLASMIRPREISEHAWGAGSIGSWRRDCICRTNRCSPESKTQIQPITWCMHEMQAAASEMRWEETCMQSLPRWQWKVHVHGEPAMGWKGFQILQGECGYQEIRHVPYSYGLTQIELSCRQRLNQEPSSMLLCQSRNRLRAEAHRHLKDSADHSHLSTRLLLQSNYCSTISPIQPHRSHPVTLTFKPHSMNFSSLWLFRTHLFSLL